MLFNSVRYGFFLIVVFVVFWALIRVRLARMLFLLAASYFFYANWNPTFLLLIWFSSSLDYVLGWSMVRTDQQWAKRLMLISSITANLGILCIFKYADFFLGSASHFVELFGLDPIRLRLSLILPVGISFYTFQTMSYIIDIYRGKLSPTDQYHEYLLYVSFFPQLVAGPIVRASHLLPQFGRTPKLDENQGSRALWLIMGGLFKKVVIADFLAINLVDRVFSLPEMYTSWEILAAIYGYALQIYCDFSGYSDIAIGSALLLGYKIPINFNAPYIAQNLRDFWRRWHISLSTWFRDYLYIPLGGSRKGPYRTYFNLWVTMMLCGLWHGAEWKFLFWGAMHGVGLTVTRIVQRALGREGAKTQAGKIINLVLTFHFVCLAWVFFRAESMESALYLLQGLFRFVGGAPNLAPAAVIVILIGCALHLLPTRWEDVFRRQFSRLPAHAQGLVLFVLIIVLYSVASSEVVPFIYYQF